MFRYIGEKITILIFVLIGISLIAFLLGILAPGDPAELALSKGGIYSPTPEQISSVKHELGLDKPLHIQYINWMKNLSKGDLGESFVSGEKVISVMKRRVPVTINLALSSILITSFLGILFGIISANFRNGKIDLVIKFFTNVMLSLPSFWLAIIMIFVFSEKFRWLPTSGIGGLKYMIMPAISLSFSTIAITTRLMRSSMIEEFGKQYYLAAISRGISKKSLLFKHAFINAIVPIITLLGNYFGAILGGAAIIESIFALPGIGSYAIEAIGMKDFPVLQAYVLLTGGIFVIVTTLVDIISVLLNPKIRLGKG